jgi:uncharacterized protein YutE (UPF0331/DUF86 family)
MWLLLGLILPEVSTFRWYYFRGGLPSVYRRASDDYVSQIVEKSSEFVGKTIAYFFKTFPPDTYRNKFLEAKSLQIIPSELVNSLTKMSTLRNKIAHDNNSVNKTLEVYPKMGRIITTAYAMYELTNTYYRYLDDKDLVISDILVDKKYLTTRSDNHRSINSHGSIQVKENLEKLRLRLVDDLSIPSFMINTAAIKKICQLI